MSDILDRIIHKLPGEGGNGRPGPIRVMTIRMPAELHRVLKAEAQVRKTSANKLAVAKLTIRSDLLDRLAAAEATEAAKLQHRPPGSSI